MLVSFSVSNFRSFGEEVTLNMVASNKLTDHPNHRVEIDQTGKHLLRSAVIYGANGAGKSNLVKAMAFAQKAIQTQECELSYLSIPGYSNENAETPCSFEFRFLLGDRVFIYGFDIRVGRFKNEWLSFVEGDDEPLIFERDTAGKTVVNANVADRFQNDPVMFKTLSVLEQLDTAPDQLFLNRILSLPEHAQGPTLGAILQWLTKDLQILGPENESPNVLLTLDSDPSQRRFSAEYLKAAGTGISSLGFLQYEFKHEDFSELVSSTKGEPKVLSADSYMFRGPQGNIVRRLIAGHQTPTSQFALPFAEESDGTKQLLRFLPFLHTQPGEKKVVVIDELDRSLHPLMCWEFIKCFSESDPGARKQLIVTTHESHLLHQDLLRRDEYWFVEKDQNQQSHLTSLAEYNVRNDLKLQKGYLEGRFGAIPILGDLSGLFGCGNGDSEHAQKEASVGSAERDSA